MKLFLGALAGVTLSIVFASSAEAGWDEYAKIPVRVLAERTVVNLAPCPLAPEPSCSAPNPPRIWVFDPSGEDELIGWTYYHELGHVMDYVVLTENDRAVLMGSMGLSGPWRTAANSPHEQFAQAFSVCAAFGPRMTFRQAKSRFVFFDKDGVDVRTARMSVGYGWNPTLSQQRNVCLIIGRILGRIRT